MKRIILTAVLITTVCLTSFARKFVAEGKTFTAYGDYRIEIDDNYVTINGLQHKPYIISYANSGLETRVVITMEKNCRKYYVFSEDLSVQYVSNKDYFGVEKLDKELEKEGFMTSESSLNKAEYFRQKVITPGNNWKREKTLLIAAYFPALLNNTL